MYVLNILIASTLFITCRTAYLDNLEKCSYKDEECMKKTNKNILHELGKTGIPEYNVPPIDPIVVKNMSVNILDSLTLTFTDGVVKGIKDCDFTKFHIKAEQKTVSLGIVCNVLNLKGHFVMSGASEAVQSLIGGNTLNGEGNGKVRLEKFRLNYTSPFTLVKHDDGKTYMQRPDKVMKYKFDVDKAIFSVEKLQIGREDISKLVIAYLNENYKLIMQNFGKVFMDKAMEFYFEFSKNIYDHIPLEMIISDDLSSLVTA